MTRQGGSVSAGETADCRHLPAAAQRRLAHALVAAALRGGVPAYPRDPPPELPAHILALSAVHGVEALLAAALATAAAATSWPVALRERLRAITHAQAARELLIQHELDRLLPALAAAGVRFLLFKGTPLAYALYPHPYQRARGDTDLLIPPSDRGRAEAVLLGAGYRTAATAGGDLAAYERTYSKTDHAGVEHHLDLHWQLSNSQIFARAFGFAALATAAVPVPALGPHARMPHPVHGLLIACLHRVTHLHAPYVVDGVPYREANRLIWLYDIHRLAHRLSPDDWDGLVALASAKGLRALCLDGLTATQRTLGTAIPASLPGRLAAPCRAGAHGGGCTGRRCHGSAGWRSSPASSPAWWWGHPCRRRRGGVWRGRSCWCWWAPWMIAIAWAPAGGCWPRSARG